MKEISIPEDAPAHITIIKVLRYLVLDVQICLAGVVL